MGLKKKVTTKDIADHVGLSQSAVSMILNNKSNVSFSESTKKKVFDAAKELGYQKKKKQTESKNKPLSKVILIIYYTTLIHSITERAHDYGYLTFVAPTLRNPSTEQYYLDLMKNDLDTAGIIYLYPTSFLPEVNEMSKQIPIVNIGDKNDEITFDSIHISSVKPARLVAEHLISLGHRKITYISTPITDIERSRSKRYDALVATFKEHGFGDDCVQIRSLSPGEYNLLSPNLLEYSSGYNLTKQILEEGTDCTAFVGYNDMVAFGILDALYEMKYKVPNDFSVLSLIHI